MVEFVESPVQNTDFKKIIAARMLPLGWEIPEPVLVRMTDFEYDDLSRCGIGSSVSVFNLQHPKVSDLISENQRGKLQFAVRIAQSGSQTVVHRDPVLDTNSPIIVLQLEDIITDQRSAEIPDPIVNNTKPITGGITDVHDFLRRKYGGSVTLGAIDIPYYVRIFTVKNFLH